MRTITLAIVAAVVAAGIASAGDVTRLDPSGNAAASRKATARATTMTISHYRPNVSAKRREPQRQQFMVGPSTADR